MICGLVELDRVKSGTVSYLSSELVEKNSVTGKKKKNKKTLANDRVQIDLVRLDFHKE